MVCFLTDRSVGAIAAGGVSGPSAVASERRQQRPQAKNRGSGSR